MAKVGNEVTVKLAADVSAQLKRVAKEKGQSVTTVITEAIHQLLGNGSVRPDFQGSSFPPDATPAEFPRSLSTDQRNRIADWASFTQPVLGRFHLRLIDVEDSERQGNHSYVGPRMEKRLILSVAATALGTHLYGERSNEGIPEKSPEFNTLKKKGDALSAYVLSEGLFYSTRGLPENHALMASIGEGAMPKAGETPEEGANPQIAFGRNFARPEVASWLQEQVRLLLDSAIGWEEFWSAVQEKQYRIWGGAIDTLENTTRFVRGNSTGPMVVLHVFDQPLILSAPFESYMGMLTVPTDVIVAANEKSMAVNFLTPRKSVLEAITGAYPDIPPGRVHVWTLGGPSRAKRISDLWKQWSELGVDLVEDGWQFLNKGLPIFRESGTYAPIYRVGVFDVSGQQHLFICDGYAASAEAIQAASLDPLLNLHTSLCMLTTKFQEPFEIDRKIMQLNPNLDQTAFKTHLSGILGRSTTLEEAAEYREILRAVERANVPCKRTLTIDDFFPNKRWQCLALSATIMDDPYTGMPGVRQIGSSRTYQITVRIASEQTTDLAGRVRIVKLTIQLELPEDEQKKAFYPLLERFYAGESYETRPVKSSDVARILNELRTLSWNSVVDEPGGNVRVNLDHVDPTVISEDKKRFILNRLRDYRRDYPFLAKHVLLPEGEERE